MNGRDGTVNSAFAPAANSSRIVLFAGQVFAAVIAVGILVWLAVTWEMMRLPALVLALVVSVAAALSVSRFRIVGEVEYHEPFSG